MHVVSRKCLLLCVTVLVAFLHPALATETEKEHAPLQQILENLASASPALGEETETEHEQQQQLLENMVSASLALGEEMNTVTSTGPEGSQAEGSKTIEELNDELAAIKTWKDAVQVSLECAFNPCQNGGTCEENSADKYTCTCPVPYTGDNCSQKLKYVFLKSSQGTFQQANAACAALDGNYHLAYIKSSRVQQEIDNRVRQMFDESVVYLWLGGTYQVGSGGRVTWFDGTTTTIPADDWQPGNPYSNSGYTHLLIKVRREATSTVNSTDKGIMNYPPNSNSNSPYPLCESA